MAFSSTFTTSSTTTPGIILSFIQPPSTNTNTTNTTNPEQPEAPETQQQQQEQQQEEAKQEENLSLLPLLFTSHILGTTSSTRYKAAHPDYAKTHVVVSAVADVQRVNVRQVRKFWADQGVAGGGGGGGVDVRVFKEVQVYGKAGGKGGDGGMCISRFPDFHYNFF